MKKIALLLLLLATASGLTAYASQEPAQPVPENLAEYQNDRFGFSFLYPADLTVGEVDHNNGLDITFGNDDTGEAYVLVIVPFSQLNVQHPSEPIQSATSLDLSETLDTVNVVNTDVTQYWFIRNNVIYQFVSLPEDKHLVSDILLPIGRPLLDALKKRHEFIVHLISIPRRHPPRPPETNPPPTAQPRSEIALFHSNLVMSCASEMRAAPFRNS